MLINGHHLSVELKKSAGVMCMVTKKLMDRVGWIIEDEDRNAEQALNSFSGTAYCLGRPAIRMPCFNWPIFLLA